MMCSSKQFNVFIKCKKSFCLLPLLPIFAGGEAASGGGVASATPSQALEGSPLYRPGERWLSHGTDVTITAAIATARYR